MNGKYLKYFLEIILKLKFLIYRTYSDRYNIHLNFLKYHDSLTYNIYNIVDAFAKFFQSIYSDPAAVYTKFDSISNHNNICLCSVSADEVFQSIKRIKSNYVQGPDGIPAFFVKDCASVLSQPMSVLFNLCIKTGTFPEKNSAYS
jgi:hypothetical protein